MRLALALGAALVATTMVAYADSDRDDRRFVFHRGDAVNADGNNDGWLSREEAGADADRLFADLDRDNNGRLTDEDGELLSREVEAEVERAMEGVRIEMENMDFDVDVDLEGINEEIERNMVFINDDDCETTTEESNGQRTVTTVCRGDDDDRAERARDRAERARDHAERARDHVERRVHVIRRGGDVLVHPIPPIPPMPPVAHVPPVPPVPHIPAFWMGGGDNDESDLNGDGRVRYERPPEPPVAPEPPHPPEPPRRR